MLNDPWLHKALSDTRSDAGFAQDHLHNKERWVGAGGSYASLAPYQIISGNNDWGAALAILGAGDTPYFAGNARFDFHRGICIANSSNTLYRVRIIWDTVSANDGIAAGRYTEFPYFRAAGDQVRKVFEIICPKIAVATMVWGQCWNATNLATVDMLFGIHEYAM